MSNSKSTPVNEMTSKRVLVLSHTDISGDSRIIKEMACLANNRYDVSGIGVRDRICHSRASAAANLKMTQITLKSRNFLYIPKTVRHAFSFFEISWKMIFSAYKIKPKIVHCNDTTVLPIGIVIKMLTGARVVYDAHELECRRNGVGRLMSFFIFSTEKLLWRWVDALIVVSPSIKDWYIKNIGNMENVEIILNAPIINKLPEIGENYLRNKFNISDGRKIFLYVGGFSAGRGIELLLEVFSKNALNSDVVFLGYGPLRSDIEKISKKCKNIHVHDAVSHEMVVPVARSADVGLCLIENVSLSDYYCLPNKLFEYIFAGIPVLASEFPDIKELIDNYNVGYYSKLDVLSIAKKIDEIQTKRSALKFDVAAVVSISWGAQEEKLAGLYSKLAL